jgi:hypothetical protein
MFRRVQGGLELMSVWVLMFVLLMGVSGLESGGGLGYFE